MSRRDSSRYYDDGYRTGGRNGGTSESRERKQEHDGGGGGRHRRSRSPATAENNGDLPYSQYYRSRFGSHSPEEYMNLRLANFDPSYQDDELRRLLENELKRYRDFQVKVVRSVGGERERIAYVNFERAGVAKDARKECSARLRELLGRRVTIDPAGVIRDQSGRAITRDQQQQHGYTGSRRSPSPYYSMRRKRSPSPLPAPTYRDKRGERPRRSHSRDSARRSGAYHNHLNHSASEAQPRRTASSRPEPRSPPPPSEYAQTDSDDLAATRTLYVGNLDRNVDVDELKRMFGKYGGLEDVDIKRQPEHAFAFVKFYNLDQAVSAKQKEFGSFLQGQRVHIGFGKPLQSRRLWVGGLGPQTSLDALAREFDRFGVVEKIDFLKGDNQAYVLFDNVDAAIEACRSLRGSSFGGAERLRMDFAAEVLPGSEKDGVNSPPLSGSGRDLSETKSSSKRNASPPSSPVASAPKRTRNGHDSDEQPATPLRSVDELLRHLRPCWTGVLVLKRSAYPIKLVRIKGNQALVDAFTRDADGRNVQLTVSQRLKLDQPKQEDVEKWTASDDHCFLLGVPASTEETPDAMGANLQPRALKLLVKYFKEKEAAGVVNLVAATGGGEDQGVLYAFPQCDFAEHLLHAAAPHTLDLLRKCSDEVLTVVVIRGAA